MNAASLALGTYVAVSQGKNLADLTDEERLIAEFSLIRDLDGDCGCSRDFTCTWNGCPRDD